jgi:hypothetical protein
MEIGPWLTRAVDERAETQARADGA